MKPAGGERTKTALALFLATAVVGIVAVTGWLRQEDARAFVVEVRERSGARLHIDPGDGILRIYEEPSGLYARTVVTDRDLAEAIEDLSAKVGFALIVPEGLAELGLTIRGITAFGPLSSGRPWNNPSLDIGTSEYAPWLCVVPGIEKPGARCQTYEGPRIFIEQHSIDPEVHLFGLDEPVDPGVEGAEAFWQTEAGLRPTSGQLTVIAGRTLFRVQVWGAEAPTTGELLPVLRSLAEQAR